MSMEHCIHCDAKIDTDRDDSCYIDDQPVCPRCRGESPERRLLGHGSIRRWDAALKVRWIGRLRYNQEVIHKLAVTLDSSQGGSVFGGGMPEPMGDCIIEEITPDMVPRGVVQALVLPGPRFTIKLDDNVFDADTREAAIAIVQRYREAHV